MRRLYIRLVSIFVSISLIAGVLSLYSINVFAAGEEIASDTSWYSDEASTYSITTASQLLGLSNLVNAGNSFESKTINIESDIDLQNIEWTPIGSSESTPFKGTVIGLTSSNCNISNLYVYTTNLYAGLFGYTDGASFTNLSVSGAVYSTNTSGSAGSVAGYAINSITVDNCVSNCYVSGAFAGGIVGFCYSLNNSAASYIISNCTNSGVVSGKVSGGILGREDNASSSVTVSVSNCINTGSISSYGTSGAVNGAICAGGIVGFVKYSKENCVLNLLSCLNQGQVVASEK
ncbi:MAG TPA: hypothetical protein PL103_02905, partial [Saccharofermentans sp.]|nr:hypothetical protein [Saccharofermentans sp.]